MNEHEVDTAGAGDCTTAVLIKELYKDKGVNLVERLSLARLEATLNEAWKVGAKCALAQWRNFGSWFKINGKITYLYEFDDLSRLAIFCIQVSRT